MNSKTSIQTTGNSLLVMLMLSPLGTVIATASTTIDGTLIVEPQQNLMSGVVFKGIFEDQNISDPPAIGPGTRLVWYPKKAAVRAGRVTGSQWNEAEIGQYSVAFGLDSRASGLAAFAVGESQAYGNYSTAVGTSHASGTGSFAAGYLAEAAGLGAVGIGTLAEVSGEGAIGLGWNLVSGAGSFSAGRFNELDACSQSVALGYGNHAVDGDDIVLIGHSNTAGANSGVAIDRSLNATSYGMLAVGHFNQTVSGSWDSWQPYDPLFVIGNGNGIANDDDFRRNAMVVLKNGDTTINGGLTVTGNVAFERQGDILMGQFGN